MIKPIQVLLTLLAIGLLCILTMLVFPERGIALSNDLVLHFPKVESLFEEDSAGTVFNVDSLLNSYAQQADSAAINDSIVAYKTKERQKVLRLQYAKPKAYLPHFFQSLADLKSGKRRKVRILHYGDSQIEGDRITSFIREKLQAEFGGSGPGMLPAKEFIPNMSITQTQSDNWIRYTVFGKRDTTVRHNRFGLRGIYSRFTPNRTDTNLADYPVTTAWVELKPSRVGYSHVKQFRVLRMHYGHNKTPVFLKVIVDGIAVATDTLAANNRSAILEWVVNATPKSIRLEFTGRDSPDIYALSLEDTRGIVMDNIAMRGSSGTIFSKIDRQQLAFQYDSEPITLVLLQFGGNTVPYIKDENAAEKYGKWFAGHIAYLKRLLPNADFVLLGPSDMSIKEQTDFVTYPFLPEVRDALKKAAFDEGVAFWDIYEVMGGRNSMPSWVAADPPLAGPDYIHFTPRGARKVAELFYKSLSEDYKAYITKVKSQKQTEDAVQTSNTNLPNDTI